MKWYRAAIYERAVTGEDATHNPITELVKTDRTVLVRTAPRSAIHDSTEGNEFDKVERTFLTKAAPSLLEGAAALEVGGVIYEVEGMSVWDAPIALKVKRCK